MKKNTVTNLIFSIGKVMFIAGIFVAGSANAQSTSTTSFSTSSLCGDGTYDPIVGSYIGNHPDVNNTNVYRFSADGGATFFDLNTLGVSADWTPGFNVTALANINIEWLRTGYHRYNLKQINMVTYPNNFIFPMILNPGTYPSLIVASGVGTFTSSDCSELDIIFTGYGYQLPSLYSDLAAAVLLAKAAAKGIPPNPSTPAFNWTVKLYKSSGPAKR